MKILISGASTGIGRACAVHLAQLGHHVWAGVRSERDEDNIRKQNVSGLTPTYLDVADAESIRDCVKTLVNKAGGLDVLINNAGIAVGGPVEAIAIEDWRRQFDINVFGAIALTQACLPMLRQSKGRILNISSISGRIAPPFMAPYAASKFALEAVSDSLRRELRRHGVRVSIIEPGPIATPIWEKAKTESAGVLASYPAEIQDVYGRTLERFNNRLDEISRTAAPVRVVIEAVEHAVMAPRPRLRYPVGRGIGFSTLLARLLPDRLLDRLFFS